jgi:alpha-L-rhamnosidase
MYEDLAGFRPLLPGYRRIEFRPEIADSGLDRVSASYESVRGTVATTWRRGPVGLELDVTVPPNATGRVYVPATRPEAVTEAGSGRMVVAADAPSVSFVGVEGDRVVFDVGSGQYQFRVTGEPGS